MILIIGFLVILACLFIIIFLPRQQAKRLKNKDVEKRLEFENETRKTVIQILGGIAFFSTFYFSYKTYLLSNEQQITNRFTETIKLLSDSNREIRIGALYALERLCKDSEKDKVSIIQIINAYIRNRAPQSSKNLLNGFVDSSLNKALSDDYSCPFYHPSNDVYAFHVDTTKQELDIQVAITILGANNSGQVHLNFTGLDLQAINFRGLNLSNSDFSYCNLTNDDFENATVDSCKFDNALANNTNFAVTKARKSTFENSLLQEANFYQADLSNSYIGGGACCYKCQFGEAVFTNGKLENDVDLRRALFWDANLTNASFEFANMDSVNLERTILKGADLRGTKGISKIELNKAKTDKTTKLP
jgi:uncharacterized protein YjbI with pentapeptide repeats